MPGLSINRPGTIPNCAMPLEIRVTGWSSLGVSIISKIGANRPGDRGLIDCEELLPANFARVVAAHGPRKAISAGTWQPTYAELNIAANRLAHELLKRGGTSGDRIAVLMAHDGPLIGAIVAVHKAGRIAVVLNPSHPPSRLKGLIEDAGARLILIDLQHRELAVEACGQNCELVQFEDHFAAGPSQDPDVRIPADATAVLVYTSGSTGRPKAVMLPHRQVIHNVGRHAAAMGFAPQDQIPLFGSPSGAQGIATTYSALLYGASLHPFPIMERGVTGLADWMLDHRITVYISSASLFRQFVKTLGTVSDFRSCAPCDWPRRRRRRTTSGLSNAFSPTNVGSSTRSHVAKRGTSARYR